MTILHGASQSMANLLCEAHRNAYYLLICRGLHLEMAVQIIRCL